MLPQMRNVFKEQSLVAKRNVVEQDQVLMDLALSPTWGTTGKPSLRRAD